MPWSTEECRRCVSPLFWVTKSPMSRRRQKPQQDRCRGCAKVPFHRHQSRSSSINTCSTTSSPNHRQHHQQNKVAAARGRAQRGARERGGGGCAAASGAERGGALRVEGGRQKSKGAEATAAEGMPGLGRGLRTVRTRCCKRGAAVPRCREQRQRAGSNGAEREAPSGGRTRLRAAARVEEAMAAWEEAGGRRPRRTARQELAAAGG